MSAAAKLLGFLTVQRGVELLISRRNTRRLLAHGAYETAPEHYPAMVALHAAWLATLWLFGRQRRLHPGFGWAFALLQVARVWVLATLGRRWTTRIIILPGAAPISAGPYRFLRHPNYAVVACELPCVSLALGLRWHALLFAAANLLVLDRRIRAENRAYGAAASTDPNSRAAASAAPDAPATEPAAGGWTARS